VGAFKAAPPSKTPPCVMCLLLHWCVNVSQDLPPLKAGNRVEVGRAQDKEKDNDRL